MSQPPDKEPSNDDSAAILLLVVVFTFASALPISTINVALPGIAHDLEMSAKSISWVPLIFLLASVILVLPCGRIADLHGRMRLFRFSIWLVIVSAIAIAFAPSASWLFLLRFIQGCAAAVGFVLVITIVSSAIEKPSRGRAFGMIASAMYFGLTIGPLIAGYLTTYLSWRWTFVVHVPFMLVALIIAHNYVRSEWQIAKGESFDWLGAIIYALGVGLLTIGVLSIPHLSSAALIITGIGVLIWFTGQQRSHPQALIKVELFAHNQSFSYSCIASMLMYAANFSSLVLVSLFLQYLKDLPAESTGWILMINPLATALVTPFAGRAADRFEPKFVASIGVALTAIGLIILALVNAATPMWILIGSMLSLGVGFAFFAPVNAHAIMGSVDEKDFATGAGAHASVRLMGQLGSMTVVSMVFALVIGQVQISPEIYPQLARALRYCFILGAIVCLPAYYFSINRGRILSAQKMESDAL